MIKKENIGAWLILIVGGISSAFAQLGANVNPELPVTIPVFQGVGLDDVELGAAEGEVGACTYNLDMTQSISSSKISGNGSITASGFDVRQNGVLVIDFEGELDFTSLATITGTLVRLTGAKSKILSITDGTGTYTEDDTEYPVTITKVVATFVFKNLHVDLENQTIGGGGDSIAKGPISATGYITATPSENGTIKGSYDAIDFPESAFPAENIVIPDVSFASSTSTKGAVTGGGSAGIGVLDDLPFGVKGKRNSRTGVSTVTLKGEGAAKSFSATLNLSDDGNLLTGSKFKNSMNVLGYKLKF